MKILIPGVAGGIARKVARRLADQGHEVIGIDARPWPSPPKTVEVHRVDVRKRAAEDIFRRRRPDVVIHMATVSALAAFGEERHRINLGSTQAVFEHSQQYGVKQVVFVGRHTFYGAAPDAPLYHTEGEPPRALEAYPELADLVAADLFAATALWRFPKMRTAILRVCYTLGAPGSGTLVSFLRGKRVPTVLGYDPLFHFMHEDDVVQAILLTVEKRLNGVFNVAGPQPVPLSDIIRHTGRTPVPLPEIVLRQLLGRFGFPRLPPGALTHLKYPIVIDASAFQRETGFTWEHDEIQTLEIFRDAAPVR
ncbi:MAG: SDR family oxidoreductase [Myxococcaceae bacterium]|nr:SDR family oxidoreductase [Myxococcaceae bacterium]